MTTLDDLRQRCAEQDAAICARLEHLFAPPASVLAAQARRRRATTASRPAWLRATMPQERPRASILSGIRAYQAITDANAHQKRTKGKGITVHPA